MNKQISNIANNSVNPISNLTNNTILPIRHSDLVFPKGNESHLVDMALRLGINHLIMCYTLDDPMIKIRKKEVELQQQENLTTEFAIIVSNQDDVGKAKNYTTTIIAYAKPELFEDKRVSHIIDMESGRRDDFIHHKNSGLNQVFIDHAIRTDKTLLVNANKLLYEKNIAQSVVLGRMLQNNIFYRKYSPKVIVVSGSFEPLQMRAWRDLQNLLNL